MHIAILGPSYPWRGGIAHHSASLYRALERAGHRVSLFNFRRLYPEIFFPGKTQLDESARPFSVPGERIFDPIDPRSWLAVGRKLFGARPDRLVLQWWHPFFAPGYAAVAALARLAGCEVVMMCHNVAPHETTPLDRALLRAAYAVPDRFVVQSAAERQRLEEVIGTRRPIREVAHPRYDIFAARERRPARDEARRRYGLEAEHVLVFFGLVRPYKGVDLLIDAAARLPADLDWQLVIAGESYESEQDYRRQIDECGLADKIRLENRYIPNEEVAQLFAAADLCVLPYRHATGSGAANAALACGVEVVMSRLPTLEQAFSDDPIRWFEPGHADALCDAIVEALVAPNTASPRPNSAGDHGRGGWRQLVDAFVEST